MVSKLMSDSAYGIKNSIATNVLCDEKGQPWAIECFNIYAKRHECINLFEAVVYNSVKQIEVLVDALIEEKVVLS